MRYLACLAACAFTIGCTSNTPFDGNPDDIAVDVTDTTISFVQSDRMQDFAIDDEQLFEGFMSGTDGEERLYVRQGDQAAIALILPGDGTSEQYFARFAPIDEMPSGDMTATGRYVGFFPFGLSDTAVVGDVNLSIDFDDGILSGEVVNRTMFIEEFSGFSSDGPPEFQLSTDIVLTDGRFGRDGQFSGTAALTEDGVVQQEGNFGGLQSGADGRTFVGEIIVEAETGVFLAD